LTPLSSRIYRPIDLKLKVKKHFYGITPHVEYDQDQIKGMGVRMPSSSPDCFYSYLKEHK